MGGTNQFGTNTCHHNKKLNWILNHLQLFWDFPKSLINEYSDKVSKRIFVWNGYVGPLSGGIHRWTENDVNSLSTLSNTNGPCVFFFLLRVRSTIRFFIIYNLNVGSRSRGVTPQDPHNLVLFGWLAVDGIPSNNSKEKRRAYMIYYWVRRERGVPSVSSLSQGKALSAHTNWWSSTMLESDMLGNTQT